MVVYTLKKRFKWKCRLSDSAAKVCRMFGLTADRLGKKSAVHSCKLKIESGDIVYITGPSGSGKTVLLKELEKQISAEKRINLSQIELSDDGPLISLITITSDDKSSRISS